MTEAYLYIPVWDKHCQVHNNQSLNQQLAHDPKNKQLQQAKTTPEYNEMYSQLHQSMPKHKQFAPFGESMQQRFANTQKYWRKNFTAKLSMGFRMLQAILIHMQSS